MFASSKNILALAAGLAICSISFAQTASPAAAASAADPLPKSAVEALAKAHADSAKKPCAVHMVYVSGRVGQEGAPFAVLAAPDNLLAEFKTAFGRNAKLTAAQAKAMRDLTRLAKQSRAEPLPVDEAVLAPFAQASGFDIEARMLCLVPQNVSVGPAARSQSR